MNNEYFTESQSKLSKVIKFSVENEHTDFYREKYGNSADSVMKVKNYDDFLEIPFLTRDEILSRDWKERNFVNENEVLMVGITSGTTNINKLLTVPITKRMLVDKTANSLESTIYREKTEKYKINNILCLVPGALNFFNGFIYFPSCGAIPIPGDYRDLEMTAKLCEQLSADGIITIPTLLINLADKLNNCDFDFESIKWISLQGEMISQNKMDAIKSLFPKAVIESFYGSNEMWYRAGYPCNKRLFEINTYHPGGKIFFEILDDEGNPVQDGSFGNLVVTDLETDKPLQLIRYMTGDVASMSKIDCSCGNHLLLKIDGRKDYDSLKIFGVTFNAIVLENSLGALMTQIKQYELHISEIKAGNKLMPKLTLMIDTDGEFNKIAEDIKVALLDKFYLSADKTLSYFVENKIFDSLVITPYIPEKNGKSKKIILDI